MVVHEDQSTVLINFGDCLGVGVDPDLGVTPPIRQEQKLKKVIKMSKIFREMTMISVHVRFLSKNPLEYTGNLVKYTILDM